MKITDQIKTELSQWLDTYWKTYMKGDLELWSTFLKEDYYNIGGTKKEIWHSKQEILDYTHTILDQMLGNTEIRNREIEVLPYGAYVMVNEFTDLYVKVDGEWSFYGPFRMSSLLEKTATGWIALHQHGSYPDRKAVEGEAFAHDALKAENKKLLHSVEERTKELVSKNRELEIEAALERVRSRTMAMQKSEELNEVVMVLFEKLKDLQIPSTAVAIQTFVNGSKDMNVFVCGDVGNGLVIDYYLLPYFDHRITNDYYEVHKKKLDFFVGNYSKKEKDSFYDYVLKLPELKDLPGEVKQMIKQSNYYSVTMASAEKSIISVNDFEGNSLSENQVDILKRFAKVFDQAYTRFLDLQKAEAQAREAQIELALEKVRARTMAMHHSSELAETSSLLFQQLKKLGINTYSSGFTIWDEENNELISWMCNADGSINPPFRMPLTENTWHFDQYKNWKEGKEFTLKDFTGEEMKSHFRYLQSFPLLDEAFKKSIAAGHPMPKRQVHHVANFSHGNLLFITLEPHPEAHDVYKRFANVFEQTYTRFLDLQKAEAQAREAQIEVALERVRSRTMGMKASEELADVAFVLFEQLRALGGNLWGTGFGLCENDADQDSFWFANKNGVFPPVSIPNTTDPAHQQMFEGWKAGKDFLAIEASGKDLKNHYDYMLSLPEVKPFFRKILDEGLSFPEWQQWNAAYFKHGYLLIITIEPYPDPNILKRFAKVFEQTYTRFLDLQKAEAQAREAKIETALEKVRSRTMGMQSSEELPEVANLLFLEIQALGIPSWSSGLNILAEDKKTAAAWMSSEGTLQEPFRLRLFGEASFDEMGDFVLSGETMLVQELGGKALKEHYGYMMSFPDLKSTFEDIKEKGLSLPEYQINHLCKFSHGFLLFITYEPVPEAHDIFKRFTKVFDQTYTRFLDLKKAEAQAREAKIETALERVRSRSLAMHKSDELNDVVAVLFEKLKELKISATAVGIAIKINGSKDSNSFVCGENEAGLVITNYRLPYFNNKISKDLSNVLEKHLDFYVGHYSKEEKDSFYTYLFENSAIANVPEDIKRMIFESPTYTISMIGVKNAIFNINDFEGKVLSESEIDIIKRFARVFDQTYTRFLDLQKAEAQAREAKIEAALERVRARTMAMQNSDELAEVSSLLFQQVKELGINTYGSGFTIWDEDSEKLISWVCNADGSLNPPFYLPMTEEPWHREQYESWKKGEDFIVKDLEGEDWKAYLRYLRSFPLMDKAFATSEAAGHLMPVRQVHHAANFSHGNLLFITLEPKPEAHELFKRFTKVFDQTYTRFIDLKKSEAQARESQIQLALERVRARTMAMQHSEELEEASQLLDKQVRSLGIETWGCAFHIYNENASESMVWDMEWFSSQQVILTPYKTPRENIFKKYYEISRTGIPLHIEKIEHSKIREHYEYLQSIPGLGLSLKKAFDSGVPLPESQIDHVAFFDLGHLLFITYKPVPEAHDIFIRFAKVFKQTYTRFLDLKKAEAQAREAKIEAALEKVRSRSLSMRKTEELKDVVLVVFEKLNSLGVAVEGGVTISIYEPGTKNQLQWVAAPDLISSNVFRLPYTEDKIIADHLNAWERGEEFFEKTYSREEKDKMCEYLFSQTDFKYLPEEVKQMVLRSESYSQSIAFAKNSSIFINSFSGKLASEDEAEIMKRFAKVFDQAYIRFLDLQKAEIQARESRIEAALEKVRSRTLAMQKSDELTQTSVVVFKQLIGLGIEPNRLFIGIIEGSHEIETWATNEDGTKIASRFVLDTNKNASIKKMYLGWKRKKPSITIDMEGQVLKDYLDYLAKEKRIPFKGGLSQTRRIQYIAFFSKGFIGMASPNEQPPETLELLERFAAVFNLTFTRFNDLQIAEANALKAEQDLIEIKEARKKAETALFELQATQKQLIQAEKMANLGELTAGIAHEIQNPLNFVNNFSEVSNELIQEIQEERVKKKEERDEELVGEILNDIKQNLEKINHHGKRADTIVKGMLEHSRSNSGKTEEINVNAFVDEYIRLAYHGLRAKDKSLNATMKTDFDPEIRKIEAVPQELGRVVVNLLTNAFYAVNEKKTLRQAQEDNDYEPTVWISTGRTKIGIEIKVRDNGMGIPKKILDKIFQPFFTTKPAGKGTGLGLSLSYDIIKAHGGDLKVETEEGTGTTFSIFLPVDQKN